MDRTNSTDYKTITDTAVVRDASSGSSAYGIQEEITRKTTPGGWSVKKRPSWFTVMKQHTGEGGVAFFSVVLAKNVR